MAFILFPKVAWKSVAQNPTFYFICLQYYIIFAHNYTNNVAINWKSKKVRIVLAVIAFIVLGSLWYALWYRPRRKINAQKEAIKKAEESLLNVAISLAQPISESDLETDVVDFKVQSNFEPSEEKDPQIEILNTQYAIRDTQYEKGNDQFPLNRNKNSQGRNVKALQLWLQQYQNEELPKYGADGRFNEETEMACIRVANRDNISKKFFVNRRELLAIQNQLMN